MTATSTDQQRLRRPRFWIGPLVAGACFALGYGITQRVVLMQQASEKPQKASFRQSSFPGESLDGLRRRYGADQPLMGDVAAKEVIDAQQRKAKEQAEAMAKEQAEAMAKEAERREQSQRAAAPQPWTPTNEPAFSAAPFPASTRDFVGEVAPEPAQPAAVLTPGSDSLPETALPEPEAFTEAPAAVAMPEPVAPQPQPAIDESLIFQAPPDAPPAP
ncbi:MAG: hypothetical protein CL859_02610 [Cyanobium sp. ARS6]|uniref:hypothetical protein n=1 Tax=Synechococcus sp. MIT S9507 TaxID=3082544 RepID=UPI000C61B657|nr:hypothetical protein [Cyanobium sp. ARS6]